MIGQKGVDIGERGGGVETHVAELSKHLAALGNEVVVYARRKYAGGDKRRKGDRKDNGVGVRFIPTIYTKNLEAIVHTFLCSVDALFRPYDIVHYHGVGPATLSWIPRLFKPRARVIATFHSQDRYHQKWGLFAKLYLWFGEFAICWFPHATISVSHTIQRFSRRAIHRQAIYIPNGADVHEVTSADTLPPFGLRPRGYILCVSRLVPHKRQDLLIEAWQTLQAGSHGQSIEKMKLVFVGGTTYTTDYEQSLKASAAGNPDILFLGYQTGDALKQLFAHAALFVQPSDSEGLPVAVLEAMSYGAPVLVSDIPENIEAIHDAGFSFKRADAQHLAQRLGELLVHPEVLDAARERGRVVIRREFSWSMIAKKTEEVYRSFRH